MGISLHDAAVHKGAGISLVTVADNVVDRLGLAAHLVPFSSCREAAAAASAQVRFQNRLADALRIHLKKHLRQRAVAALGDVFQHILRVGLAAVRKDNAGLFVIEGDFLLMLIGLSVLGIEQPFDDLVPDDRAFDNLIAVGQLHLDIQDAQRLNFQQRSHLAEAMTSRGLEPDIFAMRLMLQFHTDVNPARAAGFLVRS